MEPQAALTDEFKEQFANPRTAGCASRASHCRQMNFFLQVLVFLIALGGAAAVNAQPQDRSGAERSAARDAHRKTHRDDLDAALEQSGRVRIIVGLRVASQRKPASDTALQERVASAQDRLLRRLSGHALGDVKRLRFHHFMAMAVDRAALAAVLADPEVDSVAEDRPRYPSLYDTPFITRADKAWSAGFRGAGQAVAIVDTGIDSAHPFFTGKVLAEACFSHAVGSRHSSYCPHAPASTPGQQIGPGAAAYCPDVALGCWHGTHVAGIAAGRLGVLTPSTGGIAPDAAIIAVQVFQRDCSASSSSSGSCQITAFDSDILAGLEYVYSLRNSYSIAAVNLSLGSDPVSGTCDNEQPAMTSIVNSLRDAGIATVVAAGNAADLNATDYPGCISLAVSVGATTKQNVVASWSDTSPLLSLLAPGDAVTSAYPGSRFAVASGTSMATAHVTGAFAVLKSAKPAATVSELLADLQNGGLPVADVRSGIVKPLIQIGGASAEPGALDYVLGSIPTNNSGGGPGTVPNQGSSSAAVPATPEQLKAILPILRFLLDDN